MRIAVLNFSGNVGKSIIANFLLAPSFPEANRVAIETITSDANHGDDDLITGL